MDWFQYFFSVTCKFDGDSKSDIAVYISQISCLWTNFNQIVFYQLEIHWGFKSDIVPQMSVWTTKAQFPSLWTDFNHFFSFYWKVFTWNNCLIINFRIMVICGIDFDMVYYSVLFAANLYLSIFVWSSDI